MKILQILKRHPKKSIFFSSVLGFGVKYASSRYQEESLMRKYCHEALKYGEKSLHSSEKERHVTVILNPAANDGKSKANYEKYCAPLLHLAGLKVALVRTEHEGQAKEIMGLMANTSAVVVAGGDGTLSEILTGLLRRDDAKTASHLLPLGILPLGENNTVASTIWGFSGKPKAKEFADATMAIIKNIHRSLSVIEVKPIASSEDEPPKSIFAASYLEWGAFRDATERKSLYWYWAFLKKYMVYIFSTYKDLAWNCDATLEFSLPCSGCSRCEANQNKNTHSFDEQRKDPPRKWWLFFIPRPKIINKNEVKQIDYSNIHNDACGKMSQLTLENISDLRISTPNTPSMKDLPEYALSLQIGQKNLGSLQFIKEGWHRQYSKQHNYETSMHVGEIFIDPSHDARIDKKGKDRELSIDNDAYEVKAMRILPKPNAVTIFASSPSPT